MTVRKISQTQMEERMKNGLCYSCDSKWSRDHVCSVLKLFLIEVVGKTDKDKMSDIPQEKDDPTEFFLEEFSEISLNAVICTPSPKTMRIVGILMYQQVIILIDNFLGTKIPATFGFQPIDQDSITVRVTNGQEMTSPEKCGEVGIKMQGDVFRTDLFILPLAGCDIILGIQWLRTLVHII
jgi:hypothetical protein